MEALNQYLDTILPKSEPKKSNTNPCCKDKNNRVYNSEWYSCRECGLIMDTTKEVAEYTSNLSFIVKSFIPMSYKFRHLVRLQKWQNYSYYEVRDDKLMSFIDNLPIRNREIKNFTKVIFKDEFHKVRTRAKVKNGLICYAIYKAHLMFNEDVDIDDLFELLEITEKHYNSSVKKLKEDKLFYPKNINKYITLTGNKINKNKLIQAYNTFLCKYNKYNSKTIILSLIYYFLRDRTF